MRFVLQFLVMLWRAVVRVTPPLPRAPRIIKHNLHPFMERAYGKIVGGGGAAPSFGRALAAVSVAFFIVAAVLTMLVLSHSAGGADPSHSLAIVGLTSASLRQEKAKKVAAARGVMEAAATEKRELTEAETARISELHAEAAEFDAKISMAETQENLEAEQGRSMGVVAGRQDSNGGASANAANDPFKDLTVEQRGNVVGRVVRALAAGKGDVERSMAFAKKTFGEDDLAYRALSSSDETAGGAIVPDTLAGAVIELLRPMSAVRQLNPVIIPMGTGTLRLPKISGGAAASYVGENTNAGKTEPTFGQLTLTFKKLLSLVPVSNDLLRYATPGVDQIVRDDLTSATGQLSDLKFIRGLGTEFSPKGMRYWAPSANVIPANGTVNLANVTTDLGKLILALEEANVRMLRPGWIFAPRIKHYLMTVRDTNGNFAFRDEMLQGTLWGMPFRSTTQVPKNLGGGTESEVYLADFADVVIGEAQNLLLDASKEAAYHDGSSVQAAFSLDQTIVRALQEHDFGMRHEESVAVLTEVTWGA